MTARLIVLWAVPGPWPGSDEPDPDGFRDVVTAALTEERRAQAGPLSQDDVRRHTTASMAIERIARLRGSPVGTISAPGITAWQSAGAAPPRAAAGFHPPGAAVNWLLAFACDLPSAGRAAAEEVARQLKASRHGLVLSPGPAREGVMLPSPGLPESPAQKPDLAAPEAAAQLLREPPGWGPFAGSPPRRASAERLWQQLAECVQEGEPLLVGSGARHDVLAEALRSAVGVVAAPAQVRILYVDGSEAEPFPLRPGRWQPRRAEGRSIRLGLMSMRHTTMDAEVDGYWFRNRLVSTSRTLAETDAFCAAETVRKMGQLWSAGVTHIELVHTGFEPAAVGFYRGLLRWLDETHAGLTVQPWYPMGTLAAGTPWGAAVGELR